MGRNLLGIHRGEQRIEIPAFLRNAKGVTALGNYQPPEPALPFVTVAPAEPGDILNDGFTAAFQEEQQIMTDNADNRPLNVRHAESCAAIVAGLQDVAATLRERIAADQAELAATERTIEGYQHAVDVMNPVPFSPADPIAAGGQPPAPTPVPVPPGNPATA